MADGIIHAAVDLHSGLADIAAPFRAWLSAATEGSTQLSSKKGPLDSTSFHAVHQNVGEKPVWIKARCHF
jgi:hypothetical protein